MRESCAYLEFAVEVGDCSAAVLCGHLQCGFEWNNSGTPCDRRHVFIDLVLKSHKGRDQDCRRFQTLCSRSFRKCYSRQAKTCWACRACLTCSSGKPLLSNLPCRRAATGACASCNKTMRICAKSYIPGVFLLFPGLVLHDFDC